MRDGSLTRQTAQKQIVDQTKDRGVQPDPERQCDDRNRRGTQEICGAGAKQTLNHSYHS